MPDGVLRIAIVDDDSWVRRGRAAALGESATTVVVSTWSPDEALATTADDLVGHVDVVLVDAHDESAGFDKFVGVRVVAHVRELCGRELPRIVVITGHVYNDLLRIRLAEAGADFLYAHSDVRSPEALLEAISRAWTSAGAPEPVSTGINTAVDWAARNLGEPALQNESQKALPVTRRSIITARHRLARYVAPNSDGAVPTWKEVSAFLDRARGKERRN